MKVVYSDRYHIDIGLHVFPTIKYRSVRETLAAERQTSGLTFVEPPPVEWSDLALVHTIEYLEKLRTGDMTDEELAELELPWSPEVVEGFRLMTGGTLEAGVLAMDGSPSVVAHIGGGFHHAFANHGEGFCVFNDVAVSIRVLRRDRALGRAAIVDLDVHHGNGTAMIFGQDPTVFTFSMHQQYNYPAFKPRGSLDIGLDDKTGDERYLRLLESALPKVMGFEPEIVFYLAGADPFREDQLGGLGLTVEGLRERDRVVLEAVSAAGVPVVVLLAGGYARRVEDTVAIHVATIVQASKIAGGSGSPVVP